jgi:hypothetical protein
LVSPNNPYKNVRFSIIGGRRENMHTAIVVGSVSAAAHEELLAAHATVERIHQDPPLFLVGLEHQLSYRAYDGGEYQDLELEDGRLVIRSQGLEVTYNRRPYNIAETSITSIYD